MPVRSALVVVAGVLIFLGAPAAAAEPPAASPAADPPAASLDSTRLTSRRLYVATQADASLIVEYYEPVAAGSGAGREGAASSDRKKRPDRKGRRGDKEAAAKTVETPLPVIFFSGGHGWTPVHQDSASHLAREGRHVLGIETPEYFKGPVQNPAVAADFRTLRTWLNGKAGRPADAPVIVAGFAYGAEMAAYIVNRARAEGVRGVVMIAPDTRGATVYRVSVILKLDPPPGEEFDVRREVGLLPPIPVALIQGEHDRDGEAPVLLPLVRGPRRFVPVPGGDHQFRDVRGAYLAILSQSLRWIEQEGAIPAGGPGPAPSPPPSGPVRPGSPQPGV
jgi:type IV secretory pathway VirJ component